MKRVGNLYQQIVSINNLEAADIIAQRGKSKQYGVILHNRNREKNIAELHHSLINKTYKTSPYNTFFIHDPQRVPGKVSNQCGY